MSTAVTRSHAGQATPPLARRSPRPWLQAEHGAGLRRAVARLVVRSAPLAVAACAPVVTPTVTIPAAAPAALAAVGTAPPAPSSPHMDIPREPVLALLARVRGMKHDEDIAHCVELRVHGSYKLGPDDAPLRSEAAHPLSEPVLAPAVESGPWPRVVSRETNLRVLLYVDRADLLRRPWRDAPVLPVDPRGESGAWLRPGAPVRPLTTQGGTARVSYLGPIAFEGEVAVHDFDEVFPRPLYGPETQVTPDGFVSGGVTITRAPGGAPLARVSAEKHGALGVKRAGPAKDGWTPVSYEDDAVKVRGYVPASAYRDSAAGSGGSWGQGGLRSAAGRIAKRGPSVVLAAGDVALGRPAGEPVAIAAGAYAAGVKEQRDGHASFEVATEWGAVTLWVSGGKVVAPP